MTPTTTIYTATMYKCGCIAENDISTGYEPGRCCEVCKAPISKVVVRETHPELMKAISKYANEVD